MKFRFYILLILLAFTILSCDDEWFSAGKVIQKEFSVEEFNRLFIEDNFEVYLIQDTTCKIIVEAGEKIIPNINFYHDSDQTLTISNQNKNDWLRSYDMIKLYISVKQLRYLKVTGCSNISCSDTLITPSLHALSLDEYADFDIQIKTDNLYFVTSESSGGYYKFSGETINWGFWARGSSIIESRDMKSTKAVVKSESIGNCYIHVNDIIEANIYNTGNVYYTGNPQTITYINEQAKKQLIKLD